MVPLTFTFLEWSPWSLQGLEKEYDSSRPWIIHCAFLGHPLSMPSQVILVVKNLPANAGDVRDTSSIPGSGRSPGRGNDSPPQYVCVDRGAWQAIVHRVANSRIRLKRFSMHRLCQAPGMSKTHYRVASADERDGHRKNATENRLWGKEERDWLNQRLGTRAAFQQGLKEWVQH